MKDPHLFSESYFSHGPYRGIRTSGLLKFFGKYYWARRFYAKLVKQFVPPPSKILEVGCGFGDLLAFLENDYRTTGVDVSKTAVSKAMKRLHRTRVYQLAAEEVESLKEKPFDMIVACHILEHLKRPKLVIQHFYQILKSRGYLLIVVPNPASVCRKLKGKKWVGFSDKTHISLYPPDKWFEMLKKANFAVVRSFGDGMWDSPYLSFIPTLIQKFIFGLPAAIQTISAVPFIPSYFGESLVIVAWKNNPLV